MLMTFASAAHASLTICNRTSYIVYTATAYARGADVETSGWTRVVPGDCRIGLTGDLMAPSYYLYAKSSLAHSGAPRAWGGTMPFCVKNAGFSLRAPSSTRICPGDAFTLPFALLNTHRLKNWTTTLTESTALGTMDAARLAGLKRLLHDNHLKTGIFDGRADKDAAASLMAFRKTMRMNEKASADDLFAALETEAFKKTAPQGYAVCNDTAAPFWVAMGQKKTRGWVSRGWWKVGARGCAQLTSDALAADKVYLLAQRQGGIPLVGGLTKLCVTDIEFEIEGRERCQRRGLSEAGFAETDTRGHSGFVAHVGDGGFISGLSPQSFTSK